MNQVCFRVHLTSGVNINFVECNVPDGEIENFFDWLWEARETGFLEIGTRETHMFIIPMEKVLFIERIPDYKDEDDE